MLLPAPHRAKEPAWTAVCQSNLHQWRLALRLCVEDHGGYPAETIEGYNLPCGCLEVGQ